MIGIKKKNEEASKICNTKVFNNVPDLIYTTNPDIVVISNESGNHLKICRKIIELNKVKNFVIEKPLDVSVEKINKFEKFIKNKKVNIFVVKQNRFNKSIVVAKKMLDNKILGKLFMISASCKWKRNQNYYNQAAWRGKRNLDGGVLMNQAIHHIDLMIYFGGNVESVIGFGETRFVNIESENIAVASVKFKNNCLGVIEATTASQPSDFEGSLTIMGSKGTIKIGGFACNKIEYFKTNSNLKINFEKSSNSIDNVYGYGHKEFYKYVQLFLSKKIKINQFDTENAKKSVAVVENIVKSFKSKKVEKI